MPSSTLTVFGATGALGKHVVQRALEAGHTVRAHARTPDKLGLSHERLVVIQGDFADKASIDEAVQEAPAVVSCIGHSKGQDPAMYGVGMQHVIDAMHNAGASRLLAISGAGLELPGDEGGVGRRIIITLLKLLAGDLLKGKQAEWSTIADAPVDWTVVRVARMVERAPSGSVAVHATQVSGKTAVAYADVAAWMLDQLHSSTWSKQAPFVSGT